MIDLGQLPADPQQRLLLLEAAEAAARLKALREEVDQQQARLHDALLRGRAAGISERSLARVAGVTPGRVHQITAPTNQDRTVDRDLLNQVRQRGQGQPGQGDLTRPHPTGNSS